MTLTMKKLGAAVIAAALALCIAPVVSMLAPSQAHAATKQADIAKGLALNYEENGKIRAEVEIGKYVKQEVSDGDHWLETNVYTGKQVKPKVTVKVYDENYNGFEVEKWWSSSENKLMTEKTPTHYRPLKVVNVTGKSAKDAAKLAKKKKADITIEYVNNVEIGVGQVVIKGAYNKKYYKNCAYKGTIYRAFDIQPAQVKKVTVKAGKKALTVSWKKVKGVSGYRVAVRDKDADASVQSVWVDAKKKSVKIKGLKAKRTYVVSVTPIKADTLSSYKETSYARYYDKYTTDEWGDQVGVGEPKTLIYDGPYASVGYIAGQTSPVKEKKTK